jgi:hypothetical protein
MDKIKQAIDLLNDINMDCVTGNISKSKYLRFIEKDIQASLPTFYRIRKVRKGITNS